MGQANLLLAGLDIGLTAKATTGLLKSSTKTAAAFSKIKPAQLAQVMKEVSAGNLEKARSVLRKVGQVSDEVADEILRSFDGLRGERLAIEGGPGNAVGDAIDPKQPMQSRGNARGSSQTTAPNPNIAPEIVAKWSKTKNWKEVEQFIGQQAGDKLPKGYYYRTLNKGTPEEHIVINRPWGKGNDAETVPLQIAEDGTFQITTQVTNRISNPAAMRKNFEAAYKKLQPGYWIHHLIPDEVVRNNALAKFARGIGYDLDRASNLEGLAGKEEWAKISTGQTKAPGEGYSDAVGHWSSHKDYSNQVSRYLDERFEKLETEFGDLDQALKDPEQKKRLIQKVDKVMQDAENHFRGLIQRGNVPKTPDGRMTWNNEQTKPTA
jgi:exonuclease VII small subunit